MLSLKNLLLLTPVALPALAMPTDSTPFELEARTKSGTRSAQACGCVHNGDAGRWDDDMSPGDRLADLCSRGGGCHSAKIGRLCVAGDMSQCGCASASGKEWESWHGNWFLWTAIQCGGLQVTMTG